MNGNDDGFYYLRGIPVPETPLPDQNPQPWQKTEVVGRPLPRVDAYERVSGNAIYPSDIVLPTCSMQPYSVVLIPMQSSGK